MSDKLSDKFLESFAKRASSLFESRKVSAKSEVESLQEQIKDVDRKINAARIGGAGHLGKLAEQKSLLQFQLQEAKANAPVAPVEVEIEEALKPMPSEADDIRTVNSLRSKKRTSFGLTTKEKGQLSRAEFRLRSRGHNLKKEEIEITELHMSLLEAHGIEKKVAEKVKKVFDGMSDAEKAAFMKSYLKNPKAAMDYMFADMKKMAKEEVEIEEALDPVDPKAVKKKFDDRKDKDIDNDGDTDKSDEYLHKRRQAISKALAKEEVELEEKMGDDDWVHINRVGSFYNPKKDTIVGYSKSPKDPNRAPKLKAGANSAMRIADAKKKGFVVKEEVELDEARWEYKGDKTYMVGGNLRYDDKIEYKLSKANADILNKYMKQAKSDAERSKVWTMFWDSKETGDKATGPEKAIAFAKKAIKEEVELDEVLDDPKAMDRYRSKAKMASDRARNSATAKIVRGKGDYSDEKNTIRKREKGLDMADRNADRKFRKQYNKEEVELDEGYTINHKTFSSAVQHAKSQVEKQGYSIDDDEWDRKVAMGPRKPGKGKTNRYTIELMKNGKPTKRMLQMQVYYDEGRYELNMYVS